MLSAVKSLFLRLVQFQQAARLRLAEQLAHTRSPPQPTATDANITARPLAKLPTRAPQLNGLANPAQWDDPEWLAVHRELRAYAVDAHCFAEDKEFAYRKGWEWTQTLWGLQRLGMLQPSTRALGVGAGREPVLFFLCDRIKQVVGTDLYGNPAWTSEGGKEANPEFLREPEKFCPRPFDSSRLRLMHMDGTKLSFGDQEFDFVWSLSSIEHFGSHEAASQAIREMARVTRLNGIVVVATELIITPGIEDHPEYFTVQMFERFVLGASKQLLPLQPMSYELPALEYLVDPIMVNLGQDVHRLRHHIILNDGKNQWTSAIVFFRKV
jgi:SAM-dependent methyltransferase